MSDVAKGTPVKQYNVSIIFDSSLSKFSIDYTNNRTDMGVPSYNYEDIDIIQSDVNELGVYFEKIDIIRGRFVACNNMHRPYILFSQLQFYDILNDVWNDERNG